VAIILTNDADGSEASITSLFPTLPMFQAHQKNPKLSENGMLERLLHFAWYSLFVFFGIVWRAGGKSHDYLQLISCVQLSFVIRHAAQNKGVTNS
jgi:hypothetical protein